MINNVVLQGRLTKDPVLRTTTSGKSVCGLSIASDDGYGATKVTIFMEVTAWNKTAEYCAQYLRKGNMVIVTGRLVQRKYKNRQGIEVSTTEITASQVENVTPKDQAPATENEAAVEAQKPVSHNVAGLGVNDDDLPF